RHCGSWSSQQRTKILLDPGDHAAVCLLRLFIFVEDADRGHSIVGRIDHVVGHETLDVADDRNGAFLDPACQFLGRTSLRLGLTDGGIHEILLPAEQIGASFARAPARDRTPWSATTPSPVYEPRFRARTTWKEWSGDFFDRSRDQAPVPDYHG